MSAHPTSERSLLGSSLVARYELRAVLGRGGMGEVYEAVDRQLNRTVAVKILRPELAADRRFPARFRREARTVAGLSHSGIVAVYDVGEDDGNTFIVMELVAGRTVGDLIESESPLDPGRVARIGMSAAQALAHAHSRGVVHRDVAPGNLMVTSGDEVKVLDFGIARAARGSARPGSGTTRGTVAYVAPEQLSGHTPDHRADIYGLGAVLYELAMGRAAFTGATADEVAERARTEYPIDQGCWPAFRPACRRPSAMPRQGPSRPSIRRRHARRAVVAGGARLPLPPSAPSPLVGRPPPRPCRCHER